MQISFDQFTDRIRSCRELNALYIYLKQTLALPNDLNDLLRAEVVNSVSALDRLLHDLVRIGMIETFNGSRIATSKYKNFTISVDTLSNIQQSIVDNKDYPVVPFPEYWFEQEVILRHKTLAFQDPDKITDGLSHIWDEPHKWQIISRMMSVDEKVAKTTLKNIVNRRNQIVHEADINLQTGLSNNIDEGDAVETVDFISKLGVSIFDCVKRR